MDTRIAITNLTDDQRRFIIDHLAANPKLRAALTDAVNLAYRCGI